MHDLTDLDSGFSVFEINLQEKRLTYLASARKLNEGPKRKSMAHIFLGYFCRGKLSKIAPSGNGSFFFKSVMQKWFNITSILYSFHDLLFRGEASTFFLGENIFILRPIHLYISNLPKLGKVRIVQKAPIFHKTALPHT